MTPNQYQAIDLALESALIAGLLGGYVSGLVTGLCVSVPAMFAGEYMSMPLFSAAGILGGLMRDMAPEKEDIWYFSGFIDLNAYRVLREAVERRRVFERHAIERSAFNLICNVVIVITESLRIGIAELFPGHGTFSIAKNWNGSAPVHFIALAVTTLFSVSIPIRIWASVRAERKLETQQSRLTEARLAALTNQINPHFLFNTLNSIATLIRLDPDKAQEHDLQTLQHSAPALTENGEFLAIARRDPLHRRLSRYRDGTLRRQAQVLQGNRRERVGPAGAEHDPTAHHREFDQAWVGQQGRWRNNLAAGPR